MNNAYKLSGKSGNIFILGLLIGPILITLLCIIYSYIDVYNPFVYFTLLVFIGLLFGIILIQKLVIRLSKCRNVTSSIIYGLVVGIFGIYANWCSFLYVMLSKNNFPIDLTELMLNPSMIYEITNALSEEGYYDVFGFTVKGGFLWFVWIVEAIGILGAGALGGLLVLHEEVYCEDCNRWAEDLNFDLRLAIENKDLSKQIIESNIIKILDFPIYEGENSEHIRVNLHQCSKCQSTSTIDVDLMTYETNDKGEIKENNEDFSEIYILNNSQLKKFTNKKNGTAQQFV